MFKFTSAKWITRMEWAAAELAQIWEAGGSQYLLCLPNLLPALLPAHSSTRHLLLDCEIGGDGDAT